MSQLDQLKQLFGPQMISKSDCNLDRRYYKTLDVTTTYYFNSQGFLQSRENPPDTLKADKKGKMGALS